MLSRPAREAKKRNYYWKSNLVGEKGRNKRIKGTLFFAIGDPEINQYPVKKWCQSMCFHFSVLF